MSGTSKPNTDIALVFGGGGKAAPAGGPAKGPMASALDEAEAAPDGDENEGGESVPPEFATHAEEAFDPERSLEERTAALYRAIQSCH